MTHRDVIDIIAAAACPQCGAPAGVSCVDPSPDGDRRRATIHDARVDAAERALVTPIEDLPDDELRHLAVTAAALLVIDGARKYGFVQGGPPIGVEQCEHAIAAATERGIVVTSEDSQARALAFVAEFNSTVTP